jgi:hypothetical protein
VAFACDRVTEQNTNGCDSRSWCQLIGYLSPGQTLAPFSMVYLTGPVGFRNDGRPTITRVFGGAASFDGWRGVC